MKKHIDERGYFQELFKNDGFSVEQISICSINPGQIRGGHYHKNLVENFIVIEGNMILTLKEDENEYTVVMHPGDSYLINPPIKHTVTSIAGCKFLILADKIFDPENTDTYNDR